MSPTYEPVDPFQRDWLKISAEERGVFMDKILTQFIPGLDSGEMPAGLRVKGVQGAKGVFEMTWAPDGRATFEYGPEKIPGQPHIIWRRIGGHEIFGRP